MRGPARTGCRMESNEGLRFRQRGCREDRRAIEVAREMERAVEGISFVFVKPNEDVPFADEPRVVILDTVHGIQEVALIEGDESTR